MASDTNGTDPTSKTAHEKVLAEIAASKKRAASGDEDAGDNGPSENGGSGNGDDSDGSGGAFSASGATPRDAWEIFTAEDRRRQRAAFALALAINAALMLALGVFGRVRIFVPNAPSDSISVVFVDLPEDPIFPELRDPRTLP
ncbi:MAG: hypothetical protein AAGJ87_14495, partial [Pseudomonadota bacterium]